MKWEIFSIKLIPGNTDIASISIILLYLGVRQFSRSVMSESLRPHGLQNARPPCPSPTPGACSTSCSSSRWCHPIASSSVVPFSSCLQSFLASGSFPVSPFFALGGQSIGASYRFTRGERRLYSDTNLSARNVPHCGKYLRETKTCFQ